MASAANIGGAASASSTAIDVTIVMPCLNEIGSLPHCILNARDALAQMAKQYGVAGEILIADNGSTDGGQSLAVSLGARVVDVAERGYGAALIGGARAARGRFILMADADGSYDFTDGVAMIGKLLDGADLCMGSRFKGAIKPGAMPWKNRYIGNPILTGILNLFFRTGISDAHCGIRAIRRDAFFNLHLSGAGMEFASEMVIKARLKKLKIAETPATLSPDLRGRPPHLRPWRDGWRHLRYLVMLSPTWAFALPAAAAMSVSSFILGVAFLYLVGVIPGEPRFGASWTIAAGFVFANGHLAAMMAVATHLYGVKMGYRTLRPFVRKTGKYLTLETMLITGAGMILLGFIGFVLIARAWTLGGFVALPNTLPLVLASLSGAVGVQTIFGGLLLGIVLGNNADFLGASKAIDDGEAPAATPIERAARKQGPAGDPPMTPGGRQSAKA